MLSGAPSGGRDPELSAAYTGWASDSVTESILATRHLLGKS
jgi:hypothetical protein